MLSGQSQTVVANVSEEVILNCTVSSSPDPMYSWSIPDSCLSCPSTSNDSVLNFTGNDNNDGKYICEARNKHGIISMSFMVIIPCKRIHTHTHTHMHMYFHTDTHMYVCMYRHRLY